MLLVVSEVYIAPYSRGESWKHYVVETKCFATPSLFSSFARLRIKIIVFDQLCLSNYQYTIMVNV